MWGNQGFKEVAELNKLKLEVPAGLLVLPGQVSSIIAQLTKLKTLDTLPSLLNKVTNALNRFAQVIESALQTTGEKSVPLVCQAGFHPAEGENNTRQSTIIQLLQQRTAKDVANANLNTKLILIKSPITTTIIPPITITTFVHFQSPFLSSPPKTSSQSKGELIKNKGKEAISHKEAEEEESETDSKPIVRLTGSMAESSKKKHLKKFDFVTEKGDHVHLTKEQIKEQKRIEESVKANMDKKEDEIGKEELVDLLGSDVVTNVYKAKIKYDKYCDKMLNRRALGKLTNYDVLSKGKGPITLKVYRDDGSNKTIPNFKASDLHLSEWREVMQYFRSTKKYKSSVQYKDHLTGTMLNEPSLGMIMFNSYQRQHFVSIEDFGDFTNEMLLTVQANLLYKTSHQGHWNKDRSFAKTLLQFSSNLAKVIEALPTC
ncbi:hypothetical protein Tco_0209322 [Tanacetum coccineum]